MFCSVDNCDSKHYANGYCQRHYQQIKIHGKIITLVKRTPYDPNEFIIGEPPGDREAITRNSCF